MYGLHLRRISTIVLGFATIGCAAMPPAAPTPPPPTSATGANGTTIVAIAPAAGPRGTIWDFLGCTTLKSEICGVADCGLNLLGKAFPGLADGLPMSSLTNPAALNSSNPAIAAAAAAKADANAAGAKADALNYLGTLGCGGCYPEVEKALIAGLDDCMEIVRFAAASALADTSRNQCRYCTSNKCCSPAVRKKLVQIATERADNGCFAEPSARVRRMARVALCNCGCEGLDDPAILVPMEGPSSEEAAPPKPDPSLAVVIHEFTPSKSEASKGQTRTATGADLLANSKPSVAKSYDKSHKPNDIIVKASDSVAKPASTSAKPDGFGYSHTDTSIKMSGPRVRWERVAVSIYRFESKEDALRAMEFIRRKAMGEDVDPLNDPSLKYITTREVGWTRPQDIRTPEFSKILFDLPVGHISPVIEIGDTLVVCRVLEKVESDSSSTSTPKRSVEDNPEPEQTILPTSDSSR